jgi:hypothetical protein
MLVRDRETYQRKSLMIMPFSISDQRKRGTAEGAQRKMV